MRRTFGPIVYHSIDHMWVDAIDRLAQTQERSRDTWELLNYQATLLPDLGKTFITNPVRLLDPSYAAAETLWYISGESKTAMLEHYAPSYKKFGPVANGAYGPRVMPHMGAVCEMLREHKDSRQVVVPVYRVEDLHLARTGKCPDIPCTVTMKFYVRDGHLWMTVDMRSNDLWLGFPYDVFAFTCIQRLVAYAIDCRVGPYCHQAGSIHLYDKDIDKALRARDSMPTTVPTTEWNGAKHDVNVWQLAAEACTVERMFREGEVIDGMVESIERMPMLRDLVSMAAAKHLPEIGLRRLREPFRTALERRINAKRQRTSRA